MAERDPYLRTLCAVVERPGHIHLWKLIGPPEVHAAIIS
jgi:hypothetical protein